MVLPEGGTPHHSHVVVGAHIDMLAELASLMHLTSSHSPDKT